MQEQRERGMRSRTQVQAWLHMVVCLLQQEGRCPLWVQVQGMSRHGGSPDTSLLVVSIFLMRWEAGS